MDLLWIEISNNQETCKISWKIEDINKSLNQDNCSFDLELKINSGNNIFYIKANELIFFDDWESACIWANTTFPVFLDSKLYFPSINDSIYTIIDKNNYSIVKYWLEKYNNSSDIDSCIISNSWSNSDLFLSEEQIKDIKTNLYKEFKKEQEIRKQYEEQIPLKQDNNQTTKEENPIQNDIQKSTIKKNSNKIIEKTLEINIVNENIKQNETWEILNEQIKENEIVAWKQSDLNKINDLETNIWNSTPVEFHKDYFLFWTWIIFVLILTILLYKRFKK